MSWRDDTLTQRMGQMNLGPKSELIISIDFGTTFTGVAYALSSNLTGGDPSRIAENVKVIKTWPSASQHYSEKTPTIIAYSSDPPSWGATVKRQDETQVSHFKLGLQPNVGTHYRRPPPISNSPQSALPFLSNVNWKHPQFPEKTALDFCADYLTCVHRYIKEVFLPRQYGAVFLRNQEISYIITVPAIWTDSAKELTRQAAVRAGIPDDKLDLITEPEAAALYCATLGEEVDLEEGDRFLVCDAGGGTVDLISYLVLSREPFSVEECTVGSGGACGSMYLNKGFEALLRKKLGPQADTILTPRRLKASMTYFESSIKCNFNPYDEVCDMEYEVPLSGAIDIPEIGLEEGYMKLSRYDIQSVFHPIFAQIYELIRKQMIDVETTCRASLKVLRSMRCADYKTVFLVGGLGSNLFLIQFLQMKFKSAVTVKQPMSGYSAIMKGAVLHKLGLNAIKERVMRRHYGVEYKAPFEEGVHPEHLKTRNAAGTIVCRAACKWYANKGQKMGEGYIVKHWFSTQFDPQYYESNRPVTQTTGLVVCEDEEAPAYRNNSVMTLCSVIVDLSPLKPFKTITTSRNSYYYYVNYELGVTFGSELVFSLIHEGRVLKSVVAKYA